MNLQLKENNFLDFDVYTVNSDFNLRETQRGMAQKGDPADL